jgi:hypothetical protein
MTVINMPNIYIVINTSFIKRITLLCYICFLITSQIVTAAVPAIEKASIEDKTLLLVLAKLNNRFLNQTIEVYSNNDQALVAIEPLFDVLNLKYQLFQDKLVVWKNDKSYTLNFNDLSEKSFIEENNPKNTQVYWASDEGYVFLDIDTLNRFFESSFIVNQFQLMIEISTDKYIFPVEAIALQNSQRYRSAVLSAAQPRKQIKKPYRPITIADEYQLFTVPHGRVNASLALDNKNQKNIVAIQTTSDLLYHSAELTLGRTDDQGLASNLRLSRYKTTPDDYILGAFDNYSIGDVNGFSNSLTSNVNSGMGIIVERRPENFRRNNSAITIKESAPPGWEAELYRNSQFIKLTTVPNNGQLIFEDVETEYGNNIYQIKLYGPYGEEEIIEKNVQLTANALAKGAIAYNLYSLDKNHSVFNDNSRTQRGITDFGGTIDYGVSDNWQLGLGYSNLQNDNGSTEQFFNLKNALSFPGFLIENDLAIAQDGGYAQLTSVTGNAFGNQHFSISYESAKDFKSSRINAEDSPSQLFNANIAGNLVGWNYGFSGQYFSQNDITNFSLSNRLSRSYKKLYFTHNLTYSSFSNKVFSGSIEDPTFVEQSNTNLTGSFNVSGPILKNLRVSGAINYDPELSNPILNSSSLNIQLKVNTFDITNYITASYLPLTESSNKWQLTHNVAWDSPQFQYVFSSSYNADERWSFNAGIRFFLGYDYYNNRVLFRNKTTSSSATLDVHTYLDRQANGIPDVLDYDLSDVSFVGYEEWEGITSGANGKTILPGVPTQGVFGFGATWQEGTKTVNNDYVVFTHPGAYVEVNMPFTLDNEIFGFVLRQGNEAPIRNVKIELIGINARFETKTDQDGYYAFFGLTPDQYVLKIADDFLQNRGYTSDIIGYQFTTKYEGGFVEFDSFILQRKQDELSVLAEKVLPFTLTTDNSEAIVKSKNKEDDPRNYFTLPAKEATKIVHSLGQEATKPENTLATLPAISLPESTSATNSLSKAKVKPTVVSNQIDSNSGAFLIDNNENRDISNLSDNSTNQQFYAIQIGVYELEESAQVVMQKLIDLNPRILTENQTNKKVYKLIVGKFASRQEAVSYAKINIPKGQVYLVRLFNALQSQVIEKSSESGWVIQFLAQKSPIIDSDIDVKYRSLNSLYLAQKRSLTTGDTYYCLISRVFNSKSLANDELNKIAVNGWVTASNNFISLSELDSK